jgi:hypothetical protein
MSDEWVIEVDYSNLSKGQLKELCDQNELNTSGNKEDLLQRLNEMITPSVQETQEKIRVSCPSCSKTLMFPSDHPAELRCPACSNVFDPRVSSFVSKHGVEIKLQGTGDRQRFVFTVFILYWALLVLGWSGSLDAFRWIEDCLLCLLCLFTFLPFIGLASSLREKEASWRDVMVAIFGILSAIHALLFIGLLVLIASFS